MLINDIELLETDFFFEATGKRVHGSIKCHAISSSGQPYVSATDGFSVEEISKVRNR